jgi:anti-sigma factor ChrR (cupin superfamily)
MSDIAPGTGPAATGVDPVSSAQTQAAHAYARVLLERDVADAAAQDAVAAFRQALVQRGELPGGAQSPAADETLLALTRLMTAVSVPDRSLPEDRRQAVWASIGASSHCTCRESAALLATRANGNIQPRESAALDEHLAGCAHCRELSAQAVAAEQAFAQALTPARSGFPSPPRGAFVVLALLIAIGVGIFAANSGQTTRTVTRAVTPTPTPSPGQLVQVQVPSAPTTVPAIHVVLTPNTARTETQIRAAARAARDRTLARRRAAAQKGAAAQKRAAATSANGIALAPVSSPSSSTATPSTATGTPNSVTGAPSTASAVSGQSSLPAEAAPQQGIGSLTTAQ